MKEVVLKQEEVDVIVAVWLMIPVELRWRVSEVYARICEDVS